jgi:hypothetical protein
MQYEVEYTTLKFTFTYLTNVLYRLTESSLSVATERRDDSLVITYS